MFNSKRIISLMHPILQRILLNVFLDFSALYSHNNISDFQIIRSEYHWKYIFVNMRIWCIKNGDLMSFTCF
jgi:hypothetical protein